MGRKKVPEHGREKREGVSYVRSGRREKREKETRVRGGRNPKNGVPLKEERGEVRGKRKKKGESSTSQKPTRKTGQLKEKKRGRVESSKGATTPRSRGPAPGGAKRKGNPAFVRGGKKTRKKAPTRQGNRHRSEKKITGFLPRSSGNAPMMCPDKKKTTKGNTFKKKKGGRLERWGEIEKKHNAKEKGVQALR